MGSGASSALKVLIGDWEFRSSNELPDRGGDVSGPQNLPVFVPGAKTKLWARGFEIVCVFVPGLVPNAYAKTRGGMTAKIDDQTGVDRNDATANERERVGIAGTGFRTRVLVPPSTAWCCFGIAIEQSHQRNNGNNGLRTLWFGGFLFRSARKELLAGAPWVANGIIERARFRRPL